jgi:hypothetical protein
MQKELELQLVQEFPTFFREMYGDPKKTCMHWGCACGAGWFSLLQRLCLKLKDEADSDPQTDFYFTQIKEKFGSMRIYSSGGNKAMHNLIDTYEELSLGVCEHCGSEEDITTKGRPWWISTLCASCAGKTLNPRLL